MKLCALCKKNTANKDNTHYLTDGIIRNCLNAGGSNERERGLYFDLSNTTPYVKPNFQHETPVDKLENLYGRPVTDEEIEESKSKIEYSVNKVFCVECENIFTAIETEFQEKILPMFRNTDLTSKSYLEITDNRLLRLFFLLQIWRSSVCDEDFKEIPQNIKEELRIIILNNSNITVDELKKFPLSISYLETLGEPINYTENMVGFVSGSNPYIIMMNDIIIQYYDVGNTNYYDFWGINCKNDYKNFINHNEDLFKVKIIHDADRKDFIRRYQQSKTNISIQEIINNFITTWRSKTMQILTLDILHEYSNMIMGGKLIADKFSQSEIEKKTKEFIEEKLKIKPS